MTAARIGPAKNIVSRLMFPPIGVCNVIAATAATMWRTAAMRITRCCFGTTTISSTEMPTPMRNDWAWYGNQPPDGNSRISTTYGPKHAAPRPTPRHSRPGTSFSVHAANASARKAPATGLPSIVAAASAERQQVVAAPQREQRAQPEGEADREREPPDEQVDERADAEPPRRQAPPREPDDQAVERPARHERADDSGDADPERGGDRREQDAVAGDVVTREPLQVEHLADVLGEHGVEHLGRVVVALERRHDDDRGEHADDPPDGDLGDTRIARDEA